MRLLFDFETNGLLPWQKGGRPDIKALCAAAVDVDTGEEFVSWGADLPAFVRLCEKADTLIGHNIVGFDIPLMEHCYGFELRDSVQLYDTRLVSRARYIANMLELTIRYRRGVKGEEAREARYPEALLNQQKLHSLESWGYRTGYRKGDYLKSSGVQEEYSDELLEYCVGDVHCNRVLFDVLQQPDRLGTHQWRVPPALEVWPFYAPAPPLEAMLLECRFGHLKYLQERTGVRFNVAAATVLVGKMAERRELLTRDLRATHFPDWEADGELLVPKRDNKTRGYVKGVPFQKRVQMTFNPGSRAQIGERLKTVYGWKPKEFTETGLPKVDEAVLANINHPAAVMLSEYLLVEKRLGQIAEGDKAWLKLVTPEGLIHGTVHPTGARTSRCSHINPNMGQVPSVDSLYGPECRALFSPPDPSHVMVGIDAAKLELCMLASRLAYWDGGAYAKALLEGDPHSDWMKVTGMFIRKNQKTASYALLYGAGDGKLGSEVLNDWRQAYAQGLTKTKPPPSTAAAELGKRFRSALESRVAGLADFKEACNVAYERGWVRGLDGRIIPVNSRHGVVNDVLQSDGAIVMKHAHVMFCDAIKHLPHALLIDCHDEWQVGCPPDYAEGIGIIGVECIRGAGEKLGVKCPLSGEYKIGNNWCSTH